MNASKRGDIAGENRQRSEGEPFPDDPVRAALVGELPVLWRFALRLTRHHADAENLVQRTCVRALEQRASHVHRGRLRGWLFQLCHGIWHRELRAGSVRRQRGFNGSCTASLDRDGIDTSPHYPEGPPQASTRDAMLEDVLHAIESLPEAQRAVVLLVSVEGFGYHESAAILEVPIDTIMSRMARARIALGRRFPDAGMHGGHASLPASRSPPPATTTPTTRPGDLA